LYPGTPKAPAPSIADIPLAKYGQFFAIIPCKKPNLFIPIPINDHVGNQPKDEDTGGECTKQFGEPAGDIGGWIVANLLEGK
jgi:hypothetical protein